jgi:nucleoside-diphosphate-sugar epimerase
MSAKALNAGLRRTGWMSPACTRLALEKGAVDGIYHAVGEEGVAMRRVIEVIGRALNVPVVSIRQEEAGDYYGPLAMFAGLDMPASSALTQQRLGWTPTGISLIADIGQPGYFKV